MMIHDNTLQTTGENEGAKMPLPCPLPSDSLNFLQPSILHAWTSVHIRMEALSWDLWNSMQLEVKSQKDYTVIVLFLRWKM